MLNFSYLKRSMSLILSKINENLCAYFLCVKLNEEFSPIHDIKLIYVIEILGECPITTFSTCNIMLT